MEKKAAIDALAALAQETRLDLFRQLVRAGPPGRSAGELARTLGVKPNTLSFHLGHLANAGLVVARRDLASLSREKTIVLALAIQLFIAAFSSFLLVGLVSLYDPASAPGGDIDVGVAGNASADADAWAHVLEYLERGLRPETGPERIR